jgi:hypothetical protein
VLQPGVNDHTYDIGFFNPAVAPPATSTIGQVPVGMGNYTWIDTNKNGIQDLGESPLRGVRVTLYNPDGSTAKRLDGGDATAITDAKGYYFIDNLAAGSYYAVFTLPNGYRFTTRSSSGSTSANDSNPDSTTGQTPVFTIGTSVTGDTVADTDAKTKAVWVNPTIDAGVIPIGSVSVGNFVWRDVNGDGLQGPIDRGVRGARLSIQTAKGLPVYNIQGKLVRPQVTKKDGKFLFTNLPPGRYVVTIQYPKGFLPTVKNKPNRGRNSSSHRASSLDLSAGQSDLTLDFGVVRSRMWLIPNTR